MESNIIGYKIKNTRLDVYSMGGVDPYFNSLGKLWKNLGYVKTHIYNINDKKIYNNDCTIVAIESIEHKVVNAKEFILKAIENKEQIDKLYEEQFAKERIQQELTTYLELKEKYDKYKR